MLASWVLPSKSLPAVNLAHTPPESCRGLTPGVGGDPKVILFVTFVDWAKKKNCDAHRTKDGKTDVIVEIVM